MGTRLEFFLAKHSAYIFEWHRLRWLDRKFRYLNSQLGRDLYPARDSASMW